LLHPGPLVAAGDIEVEIADGAAPSLDEAAAAAAPAQHFLRAAWFAAAAGEAPLRTLSARRSGSGQAIAAIPLVSRRMGPIEVREVPGSYWPFRSFPVAADASEDELAAFLAAPAARSALGRVWRVGPVPAGDRAATMIAAAARRSGWTEHARRIASCFDLDLARLAASGSWPSSKRRQKLRWRERRLAALGEMVYSSVTGAQWSGEVLDVMAAAEAESWVVREGGDPKFLPGTACRRIWEGVIADPALAARLSAWLLHVGGAPAAFVFCLDAGRVRHVIANGYSERFAEGSPGQLLLYRAFQESSVSGVEKIGWGAGDAGYKSEMGAEEGSDLLDLLFVRGPLLAAVAAPLWRRRG
jgi:CelD/BcsL family acetyltransferase involved in cellulose biosynthesis